MTADTTTGLPADLKRDRTSNKAPFHDKSGDKPKRLLAHKFAELFPALDKTDLKELADDIKAHGLEEPIVLYQGFILDGRNRYRAAQMAELDLDPADRSLFDAFTGTDDGALQYVISKNLKRRHLTTSQRAMIAADIASLQQGGDRRSDQAANLPVEKTQAGAAKSLGVSERAVRTAKKVKDKGTAALKKAVRSGDMAVDTAADMAELPKPQQDAILKKARTGKKGTENVSRGARTEMKKLKRAIKEKALGEKQRALPAEKFSCILADPAWRFEPRSRETGLDRAADNHYPTQELKKILKLKVPSIAAKDSILFLCATAPMLPQALQTMKAWGFVYKTHLVWNKLGKQAPGYWFRGEHELVLLGVHGSVPCPAPGTQAGSVLRAAKGKHSAKPESLHKLIERYFPHLPKIELHRRGPARKGWSAWGNESEPAPGLRTSKLRKAVEAKAGAKARGRKRPSTP
jgi:N6-adenosine-specific RNA methylase IME4